MDESIDISLRAADSSTETLRVTPLGGSRYRLEETPLLAQNLCLGDVVELHRVEAEEYELSALLERPFVHGSYLINGTFARSYALYDFGEWVESLGGRCECVMHGFLFVHLPRGVRTRVKYELRSRIKTFLDNGGLSSVDEVRRRETGGAEPPTRSGHITIRAADDADEA